MNRPISVNGGVKLNPSHLFAIQRGLERFEVPGPRQKNGHAHVSEFVVQVHRLVAVSAGVIGLARSLHHRYGDLASAEQVERRGLRQLREAACPPGIEVDGVHERERRGLLLRISLAG